MKGKFSFHKLAIWLVMPLGLAYHVLMGWYAYDGIKSLEAQWYLVQELEGLGQEIWEQYILAQKMSIVAHAVLFVFLCSALYQSRKRMHIAWGYYITYEFFNLLLVDLLSFGVVVVGAIQTGDDALVNGSDMLWAICTSPFNLLIAAWIVILFVVKQKEKKAACQATAAEEPTV